MEGKAETEKSSFRIDDLLQRSDEMPIALTTTKREQSPRHQRALSSPDDTSSPKISQRSSITPSSSGPESPEAQPPTSPYFYPHHPLNPHPHHHHHGFALRTHFYPAGYHNPYGENNPLALHPHHVNLNPRHHINHHSMETSSGTMFHPRAAFPYHSPHPSELLALANSSLSYGEPMYHPFNFPASHLLSRLAYGMEYNSTRGIHQLIHGESKRKGGQIRFSNSQTSQLEKAFMEQKYQNANDRKKLAHSLGLSDRQVKTWFQNRRAKERKCAVREESSEKRSHQTGFSEALRLAFDRSSNEGKSLQRHD